VGTSPEQQLALGLEDDRRARVGPTFGLVESKLRPPSARPGIVARTALVERLLASPAAPVICVIAPPGYGKSTLLAQWSERLGRRVGWVSVDRRDNDPVVLLTYIAAALDRVGPIDPGVFQALTAPGVSVAGTAVPRFVSAVSTMTDPVALVLDHVELLENPACLDAVAELALALPAGSRLALASRRTPAFPVALLRAQGQLMEVGVEELAMDAREASALLEAADVELSDAEMTELAVRTEGWPVGLYLAALALKAGGSPGGSGLSFTGDDRFIADYLHAELLAQLPAERVTFLTRTAVLERMCGPLCDAVLDTTGSGEVLASLQGSNLLLVALDRRREWYRYHHLFGELLLAELERREPDLVPELHGRAASWYEANGLPEVAIDHAQATGDADRVARLVAALAQPIYAAGRVDTVRQWLAWLEERGLVERYPPVAVLGAWLQALVGRPAGALRWADAAERRPTVAAWAVGTQAPADATTDGERPGAAAGAVVPRRRQPDASRRPHRPGQLEFSELAGNGAGSGGRCRHVGWRGRPRRPNPGRRRRGRHGRQRLARHLDRAGRALSARDPTRRLGPSRGSGRAGARDRAGSAAGRLHHERTGPRGGGPYRSSPR
jgi:LuxR family maltose regulon positive regulatory protein